MAKQRLLYRLGFTGLLVVGGMVGRPSRTSAQLITRQKSQVVAVTNHLVRSTEVSNALGPFAPLEFHDRLDPEAQHTSVALTGMGYVSTRAGSALQSSGHGSRSKHVLLGALAGAGVGAVAAIAFPAKCTPSTNDVPCALGRPVEVAFDMILGTVAGGLIGALLPAGH